MQVQKPFRAYIFEILWLWKYQTVKTWYLFKVHNHSIISKSHSLSDTTDSGSHSKKSCLGKLLRLNLNLINLLMILVTVQQSSYFIVLITTLEYHCLNELIFLYFLIFSCTSNRILRIFISNLKFIKAFATWLVALIRPFLDQLFLTTFKSFLIWELLNITWCKIFSLSKEIFHLLLRNELQIL